MSIAAMTAIVLFILTATGALQHTFEQLHQRCGAVLFWLFCVLCLKIFLLSPIPEIEINIGFVPIMLGPALLAAAKTESGRVLPLAAALGVVYAAARFLLHKTETAVFVYGAAAFIAAFFFGKRCGFAAFAAAAASAPIFGALIEFAVEYIGIGYGVVQISTAVCDAQMVGAAACTAACEAFKITKKSEIKANPT